RVRLERLKYLRVKPSPMSIQIKHSPINQQAQQQNDPNRNTCLAGGRLVWFHIRSGLLCVLVHFAGALLDCGLRIADCGLAAFVSVGRAGSPLPAAALVPPATALVLIT